MSVGLYMDENVPGAVTAGLRRRGVDVLTAQEDGMTGASDPVLLARASQLGRVMFSQDDDMLREARACLRDGVPFAGVAYAHQLHITAGQAIDSLQLLAEASDPQDMLNRVEYLPF